MDSRTTVTGYDAAGRTVLESQSATLGTALADVTTGYDAATGQVASTSDGSGTISRTYDSIGRLASYQDADGNTTTYGYDVVGNVVSRLDAKSLILYGYDTTTNTILMGARLYQPATGRFLQIDPVEGGQREPLQLRLRRPGQPHRHQRRMLDGCRKHVRNAWNATRGAKALGQSTRCGLLVLPLPRLRLWWVCRLLRYWPARRVI